MDKVRTVFIDFTKTWNRNKENCNPLTYSYARNVPSYCVLFEQYKAESYLFYRQKLMIKGSNVKVVYIWRPKLW